MVHKSHAHLPLMVAGLIFAFITVVHILRIIYHIDITIAGHVIPMNLSYIGALLGFLLAIWMFKSSSSHR